jgi:hypothetical protein
LDGGAERAQGDAIVEGAREAPLVCGFAADGVLILEGELGDGVDVLGRLGGEGAAVEDVLLVAEAVLGAKGVDLGAQLRLGDARERVHDAGGGGRLGHVGGGWRVVTTMARLTGH